MESQGAAYFWLDQPRPTSDLARDVGSLENIVDQFSDVVGYTYLGQLILNDSESGAYGLFYPLQWGMKNYGPFASRDEFQQQILDDAGFRAFVLVPSLADLVQQAGPLGDGEVYYPVPYPFVGGSGALETYSKGDLWVFVSLVSQMMHG